MQLLIFLVLLLVLAWFCRRQLMNPKCHGFYRFFAFAGLLWLLVRGLPLWHDRPLSLNQLAATTLLMLSLFFVVSGVRRLRLEGGRRSRQAPAENFAFENTARLVTTGIYHYVRHPMYSSLLFLCWGLYLKEISVSGLVVALVVTASLFAAARVEERENRAFFGHSYDHYRQHSRLFIPFVL